MQQNDSLADRYLRYTSDLENPNALLRRDEDLLEQRLGRPLLAHGYMYVILVHYQGCCSCG